MSNRCWFNKFRVDQEKHPRCEREGRWHWKDAPERTLKLIHDAVWCDEHRHGNDTLIQEEDV